MFWRIGFFIMIFNMFVGYAFAVAPDLVRVRLETISDEFILSGTALSVRSVNHKIQSKYQEVAIPQTKTVRVSRGQREGKGYWSLRWSVDGPAQILTDPYLLFQGQALKSNGKELPERILLSSSEKQIDVIGVLKLDDYLTGVIASEMPLSWPLESLKAQAVAARSYTLAVIQERSQQPWHLESSVLDQVFRPLAHGEKSDYLERAEKAVLSTRGIELRIPSGKSVLKAFYHADCGGRTTLAQNVWQGGVNTGVARDNSCPTAPKSQWTLRIPAKELVKKMGIEIADMTFVRPTTRDRVSKVLLASLDGEQRILSANDFRQRLGFQDLKSTQFEVRKENEEYVFTGKGYGHGVGLCQWGSRHLGQRGWGYKEILRHYYPLARLSAGSKVN